MNTLAAISFYLSFVFGFGSGVIGFFQIGRIGSIQFFYWLSGVPPSKESDSDNVKLALGFLGIPTSFTGILASLIGLGRLKSFTDIFSYFSRNLRETVSYFASLFGRIMAKLWILIGIPAFILSVVTSRTGYGYWPRWLNEIGIQTSFQFIIAIVSSYMTAYVIGRMIGSPQRTFNKARRMYEGVVGREGYWFDHRNELEHYAQHISSLGKAMEIYGRFVPSLERTNDDISRQRLMTLHYQLALLLSTLREYDRAELAIKKSREYKQKLAGSEIWEPQEESVFESQLLFLEGELAYVRGDKERARDKFNKSTEIDVSLRDHDGLAKNEERLQLVSNV